MSVKDPWWLLLVALVPLMIWLRYRRGTSAMIIPHSSAWWRPVLVPSSRLPAICMNVGLVLLAVAMARPQRIVPQTETLHEGYDLVLAIDLSGSMLAEDYEKGGEHLNRLQAIKPVIKAFISQRPNDRIGLVVFAGRAYTMAPLTFDHVWLSQQLEKIRIGAMEDGTALGDALGVALTRLEQPQHEIGTKRLGAFIVLLTDGVSNKGLMKPDQATKIAVERGIPVYTIGAGKDGSAPYPIFDSFGKKVGYRRIIADLDERALKTIAAATGASYYRADNTQTIQKAFNQIVTKTQKIKFAAKANFRAIDLFGWLLAPGLGLVMLGAMLSRAPWRGEETT